MRDGAKTREKIMSAALRLFVEQGVKETTTRDIAAAAGVAEGTLYRHFEGKDQLAHALYVQEFARYGRLIREAGAGGGNFAARWQRVCATLCGLYDDEPHAFRYLLLTQHQNLAQLPAGLDSPLTAMQDIIAEAVAGGEIRQVEPAFGTALALGAVIQAATFSIYGALPQALRQLEPDLTRFVVDGLAARGT